jgi:hypothetical protein
MANTAPSEIVWIVFEYLFQTFFLGYSSRVNGNVLVSAASELLVSDAVKRMVKLIGGSKYVAE